MESFFQNWSNAAFTTAGLFWMAFWAFGLGYAISSAIQVLVTRARMREQMGEASPKTLTLGTFFGFISSSCSFAALSTTRALFARGAGAAPSLAFLLASTNLVVELGIVIAIFLSWQFVVAEYIGGVLLIAIVASIVVVFVPSDVEEQARQNAKVDDESGHEDDNDAPVWTRLKSAETWRAIADKYLMEWGMVWKDVLIGFTVAGVISTFVPPTFFETLFIGSGSENPAFYEVVFQSFIGPVAAFFTFIGSMGNIPLAAVLFGSGVSFAGVVAFIFSDLVVFPVLRIQAEYYGWKNALGIAAIFLVAIVITATGLHYAFDLAGMLPTPDALQTMKSQTYFEWDYSAVLNITFILATVGAVSWKVRRDGISLERPQRWSDYVLNFGVITSMLWLTGGAIVALLPTGLFT